MDIEQAKDIVTSLANGVNPITGRTLPDDSLYNDPTIIRSLYILLNHVTPPKKPAQVKLSDTEKRAKNIAEGKPRNTGLAWTVELKEELAMLFHQGKLIPELAIYFERTKGAIHAELQKQGIIDEDGKLIQK